MTRLEHLPQRAERRFTTQFHRIPKRIRFFILISLLSILTALLVSNFPISILPSYHVGDVARHDLVAPVELIVKDDVGGDDLAEEIRRNPVLMRAGEIVTAEKLPLIERVRQYQLGLRRPGRLMGLLALVGIMFFALYKSTVTSQSSRLGPRTAFWVAASALMFQTFLARVGMFGASVLSTRPEADGYGGFFQLQFAIPFATCALALSLLIGSQVALVAALMSGLLVGFISPHDLAISAFALAGSIVAIYSVQRYRTRNAVTVAPEGSHWEMNANGAGSNGGETAPPEALLPRMVKNTHTGRIAQRSNSTDMSEVKEVTASMSSARMPHTSRAGGWRSCHSARPTKEKASDADAANASTAVTWWRRSRPGAFVRIWNTVTKPTIVATSMV